MTCHDWIPTSQRLPPLNARVAWISTGGSTDHGIYNGARGWLSYRNGFVPVPVLWRMDECKGATQ
jgi:hypothetical protein